MCKIGVISLKNAKWIFIVFAAVAAVALSAGFYVAAAGAYVPDVTVVLDAGHGGFDGGVVSSEGDKESDINLNIVLKLKEELEREGVGVVLTRTGKEALGDNKREDMRKRAEIILDSSADAVISIHVNKYTSSSRRGVQVFYDDTGYGEYFAARLQSVLNTYVNARYCGREFAALSGDYYITKCGKGIPSVIVECGFISNQEDLRLLKSNEYIGTLAVHIARTVRAAKGEAGAI